MQKVTETLGSRNFFVSLVSLILLSLELNSLPTGADPGTIVDVIQNPDIGRIVSIIFLNFLNPVMKIISKTAVWDWGFLKSMNFWTQVITVVLTGVAMLGIVFPDGAAAAMVEAVFGGEFNAIWVAFGMNILNPIYHFFQKPKGAEIPERTV